MRYRIQSVPGGYRASIPIPLPDGGCLTISATATYREVRRDLERARGVQGAYEAATMEGFFGDVGNFVKKLTRNKALRKAVKTTGAVVTHPAFSAAVAMIPGVGVPIAGGIQAAVAAEKLISAATKAPKGSRKRIAARTIVKAASTVAKREARQRRLGLPVAKAVPASPKARAFRYLVQLAPAA